MYIDDFNIKYLHISNKPITVYGEAIVESIYFAGVSSTRLNDNYTHSTIELQYKTRLNTEPFWKKRTGFFKTIFRSLQKKKVALLAALL